MMAMYHPLSMYTLSLQTVNWDVALLADATECAGNRISRRPLSACSLSSLKARSPRPCNLGL